MTILMSRTLKTALLADAVISGAAGALLIIGAPMLYGVLGLPQPLLFWCGVAFMPWIAMLALIARGERSTRPVIWTIIIANLGWVAASLFAAFGPLLAPTLLGKAFILAQAVAVFVFAELQLLGLKRSARMA